MPISIVAHCHFVTAGNALMHSFHNSLSEYSSSGQILDLLSTFSEVCLTCTVEPVYNGHCISR